MIEAGLVYIHSDRTSSGFSGCGALFEGPFVVTCRHVWEQAFRAAQGGPVLVCFPPPEGNGETIFSEARLVDDCNAVSRPPDLVILESVIPVGSIVLAVARSTDAEIGPAGVLAGLAGRNPSDPSAMCEVTILGTISARIASSGLRQFTGIATHTYWVDHGCSGSPLGLDGGNMLAGILCVSETGLKPGESSIHEAFIIPATVIHRYLRLHVSREIFHNHGIEDSKIDNILETLGADQITIEEVRQRLGNYLKDIATYASELQKTVNNGSDIDATISEARKFSNEYDPKSALMILNKAIEEENNIQKKRILPLLREKCRQLKSVFDYNSAVNTLIEITHIDQECIWAWLELGDIYRITGNIESALRAYFTARDTAESRSKDREFSASCDRIGDISIEKGDRKTALEAFQAGFKVANKSAVTHPEDTYWQREISVYYGKIGQILLQNGDRAGGFGTLQASLSIRIKNLKAHPESATAHKDLATAHEKIGDFLISEGKLQAALTAYNASILLRQNLVQQCPLDLEFQRDLSLSHVNVGDVQRRYGNYQNALVEFRVALAIRVNLQNRDPGSVIAHRDLAIVHNMIGSILFRQNDFQNALKEFSASLTIFNKIATHDPENSISQLDLSTGHTRIGDVLLSLGDFEGASKAFNDSRIILVRLTIQNPDNSDWQCALAINHDRIGDMLRLQGNNESSRSAFQKAYSTRKTFSQRDSSDVLWKRSLITSSFKLSQVDPANKRTWLERAMAVVQELIACGALAPEDKWMTNDLKKRLSVSL